MKNITKLFLITLFFSISTTAFAQPTLVVADSSAPLTSLNVGNVDEFVYQLKNNGTAGSRIDSIMFKTVLNPNISFNGNFYLTYLHDSVPKLLYTTYTYHYLPHHNEYTLNAGNNYITASMFTAATRRGYLAQDSVIYLHIPFTVINCNSGTGAVDFYRDTTTIHGHYRDTVNKTTSVGVIPGNPNFTGIVTSFDSASFCPAVHKGSATIGFKVTNSDVSSGNPYADSIRLYLYCTNGVTSMNANSFKINGVSVASYVTSYTSSPYKVYLIDLTTFPAGANGHPFGSGTIADMSGAGKADDLGKDSSFTITGTIYYDTTSCPVFGPQTTWLMPGLTADWNNECNTEAFHGKQIAPSTTSMYPQLLRYLYSASQGTSTMSCPSDITNSNTNFNMNVCPAYDQYWSPNGFKWDCPSPDYRIILHVPKRGYDLDTSSSSLTAVAGTHRTSQHSKIYKFSTGNQITANPFFGCSGSKDTLKTATVEVFFNPDSIVINLGKMPLSNCNGSTAYVPNCFNVPLFLDCGDFNDSTTNIQDGNFYFTYEYICDSTSCGTCADTLATANTTTFHHCAGLCSKPVSTVQGWIFERTNLGDSNQVFPKYYNNGCAVANAVGINSGAIVTDSTVTNRNTVYPGDQVEALVNGGFDSIPSKFQTIFLQIRYPAIGGAATPYYLYELDPDKQSYFIVKGCTGVSAINNTPLYLPTPPASNRTWGDFYNGHQQVQMSYSLDSAIGHMSHTWDSLFRHDATNENLTIAAHIFLRVKNDTKPEFFSYPDYLNSGLHIVNVRTEFMANLKDATQHSYDTVHSCDSWGNSMNILQPVPGLPVGIANDSSTCDSIQFNFVFSAPASIAPNDDFPYEFRPFVELDSLVKIAIPPGYTYGRTVFYTYIDSANTNHSDNRFAGGATRHYYNISPAISGDTLKYNGVSGCWPLIDQKIPNQPEPQRYSMTIYLAPSCTLTTAKDSIMCYSGMRLGMQQSDTIYQVHVKDTLKKLLKHHNPVISLNMPPTVSSYSDSISFRFTYCTNTLDATDPWIAFENVVGYLVDIKHITLKDSTRNKTYSITNGGHLYYNSGDSGIIFDLKSMGADSCLTFIVSAYVDSNSRACPPPDSGKMVVRFGNVCSGTITNPNSTTCQNVVDTFKYDLYPTTLSLYQNGYRPNPVKLCGDTLIDSLVIQSANLSSVRDVHFYVYPPSGVRWVSSQLIYPCDTTSFKPHPTTAFNRVVSPDITNYDGTGAVQDYGWLVDKDVSIPVLPGTLTTPSGSDDNTMCVKVKMVMDCSYNTLNPIKFVVTGYSSCHKVLSSTVNVTPAVNDSCCMGKCGLASAPYNMIIDGTPTHGKSARQLHNGPITYSCMNILIRGTYIVNENVTFNDCKIALDKYALIDVDSNHTLSFTTGVQCSPSYTHLYAACDTMWRGIFVEPGSTVTMSDFGLIEDADTAIYAENGSTASIYQIQNIVFNHCYKDILVGPYSGFYPGTSLDCLFTNRNFTSVPTGYWRADYRSAPVTSISKVPNASTYTKIGWQINTVGHFEDNGQVVTYTSGNTFDNLQMAIDGYATNNLTICSDTFASCNYNSQPTIYSDGTGADSLNVGGPPSYHQPNIFRNCYRAVGCNGLHTSINILYNSIRNKASNFMASSGIYVTGMNSTGATLNIEADTVTNYQTGILCQTNTKVTGHITYNTIIDSVCAVTGGTILGIGVVEAAATTALYTVGANNITDVNAGIYLNDVYAPTATQNTINLKNPAASCTTAQYKGFGIQANSGSNATIACNKITSVSATNTYKGIYENNNAGFLIDTNTTNNTHLHIALKGGSSSGNLHKNILNAGDTGIYNGVPLANIGSLGQATNETYSGTFTNCHFAGSVSGFYYTTVGAPPTPNCPTPATHNSTPTNYTCPTVPALITNKTARVISETNPDTIPIDSVMLAYMINTAQSKDVFETNQDTNMVLAKFGALEILWQHQYLLDNNVLKSFNDTMSNAPIGKLMSIDTAMVSKNSNIDFNGLLNSLGGITPKNNVEQYLKTATQGYLDYQINGNLSSGELSNLRSIANLCPDFNGQGVYLARTVVSPYDSGVVVIYSDGCSSNNDERRMQFKDTVSSNQFSLYPNPNNGGFTVEYSLAQGQTGKLSIYSMLGQKEAEYTLNANSNKMSIANTGLGNGMHLYVIKINNNEVKRDKLVIIR